LIAQALVLAGHEATPSEIKNARAVVKQESSFNAGDQNNWDSNARAGHPSKGWAQVIDSTFKQYHAPGHNDIWNPVHNLAAGIRYADARYGSRDANRNGLHWVAVNRSMRHLGY
jgi:SLT domain-containing protein